MDDDEIENTNRRKVSPQESQEMAKSVAPETESEKSGLIDWITKFYRKYVNLSMAEVETSRRGEEGKKGEKNGDKSK